MARLGPPSFKRCPRSTPNCHEIVASQVTLKTLTSLIKGSMPFGVFPLFLALANTALEVLKLFYQARKRHININILLRLALGRPHCPRDKPGCPWDKSRFSPYLIKWRPSSPLGQTRGRRAAEKVYVVKVDVPFLLAISALRSQQRNLVTISLPMVLSF